MRERTKDSSTFGRMLGTKELRQYLSLGMKSAQALGRAAGAELRLGRRVLYDREKIDAYISRQMGAGNIGKAAHYGMDTEL